MFDHAWQNVVENLTQTFLAPWSLVSVWSLAGALLIALVATTAERREKLLSVRAALASRYATPEAWNSTKVDLVYTLFGVFVAANVLGFAILSQGWISAMVTTQLGAPLSSGLAPWLAFTLTVVCQWIAYEFAYWLNHCLSHKWRWLWAFHKVHHSAEVLTPLTIFRVHPVDTIAFYNTVAVVTGLMLGLTNWLWGSAASHAQVVGAGAVLVITITAVKHLQHSHVWIAFAGPVGRIVMSPAHHQLHHSIAPEHHDRNFGETLAIFDWIAGTLIVPTRKRQDLRFGVDDVVDPHSANGALIEPFVDAATVLAPVTKPTLSPR